MPQLFTLLRKRERERSKKGCKPLVVEDSKMRTGNHYRGGLRGPLGGNDGAREVSGVQSAGSPPSLGAMNAKKRGGVDSSLVV